MNLSNVLVRWLSKLARWTAAPKKHVAIVYFDGPLTKFPRGERNWQYEAHPGGLRIPLDASMPRPDDREVIQRREFRSEFFARVWVIARLRGFDHEKIVGEVRRL